MLPNRVSGVSGNSIGLVAVSGGLVAILAMIYTYGLVRLAELVGLVGLVGLAVLSEVK